MSVSPQQLPASDSARTAQVRRRDSSCETLPSPILAATLDAMADEWSTGHCRTAEEWLAEHPELQADPALAVRIVYEELCLREDRGEEVSSAEFYRRFPQWQAELAILLKCHHFLQPGAVAVEFPAAGESLGELQLLEELGRGALGCVFLASQSSLSDRPLVVKLTARRGQEHLSLARLQHTNIVPLYSVQDFPEAGLRALCMPYLGGRTWYAILQQLRTSSSARRTGSHVVEELAKARRPEDKAFGELGPVLGFLSRSSYVDAVCWIGACLADALHYAHQRGLAHLDIKPSNILITADGQPMLLDFHLASEIERLRKKDYLSIGGTDSYASPEQFAAMAAIRNGLEISEPLDGRSDIYSLGVVLYETLTGRLPADDDHAGLRSELRKAQPALSRGVEDILLKCLARSKAARYHDAGELATDLRLHLASLPLRNVPNRSPTERWQKWRRRRPHAVRIAAAVLAATITIIVAGSFFYSNRIRTAEDLLDQSRLEMAKKDFKLAIEHAKMGRQDLQWFPWRTELRKRLETQLTAARRAQAIDGLHQLVDKLRFLDDTQMSDQALSEILAGCERVWQARKSFVVPVDETTDGHVDSALAEQLRRDLMDLAILSARIDVGLAKPQQLAEARQTAARLLDEARETCGPSPLLDVEQRDYRVGQAFQPDKNSSAGSRPAPLDVALPTTDSAWEHCGFGRWLMHHGAYAEAVDQLKSAIDLQPDEFWAYFQLARCDFELRHYQLALESATICVALARDQAECFYNRGLCQQAIGHNSDALLDMSRALKIAARRRDPRFPQAHLERGILLFGEKRYAEAAADFNAALQQGSRPSDVHLQLARLALAQSDSAEARNWLTKSLAEDPSNPAAHALEKSLQTSKQE
jgi:serine/threonine protein kinase